MERALELALLGKGSVNPNPMVGAIIVKNNKIIGEGYHKIFGGPHAEIEAFTNAMEEVKEATMYVTLEPCAHFGKTGPCANAIVGKGIKEVVIAMKDPNPLVSGKGIKILEENGVKVTVGIMEEKSKKINEVFLHYIMNKTPFCVMKTAMTLDGKISTYSGKSKWITNKESREVVHMLRNSLSSIMVGIGTILEDNPSLTSRIEGIENIDPVRIIVDSKCRIPIDSKVLNIESNSKTIIATTKYASNDRLEAVKNKGAEILIVPTDKNNHVDLKELMKILGEMKIDSILLEGGGTLNWSALNSGVVNKIISFIAPKIIGGKDAKTPVEGEGIECLEESIFIKNMSVTALNQDLMIEGYL
jgi:diaminohydroxyphosphoribosylaminopyrimidine deaminase/5-amino-6-(5-phosphoribosylamino)uracil reductase